MKFELPRWYDLHAHFRQGDMTPFLLKDHLEMGCAGILAMPNTKPPVAKVFKSDSLPYWSVEEYLEQLKKDGGDKFSDIIVPLYLTRDTTPKMIEDGAKSGLLRAAKYYPPHGTTGSDHGWHFASFIENGVFKALQDNNVVLCVHGEEHGMSGEDYFSRTQNAEEYFYRERMPRALDAFPALKIAAEHVTTKAAVDFVSAGGKNIAASVTPQHLMYTIGHLLQGLRYHLHCMPAVKFKDDRAALLNAVTDPDNTKFYAGTDSAPHANKVTPCGCAAGCYTGGIAPQLYAEAFELGGVDLASAAGQEIFRTFLCFNGPAFYGLPIPAETFTLSKEDQRVSKLRMGAASIVPLPLGMKTDDPDQSVTIPWSIL